MSGKKEEVVTFKIDESLKRAMHGVSNRSEFIRTAIRLALDNICPLCGGAGTLTPEQKKHWVSFSKTHNIRECGRCQANHIICLSQGESDGGRVHS